MMFTFENTGFKTSGLCCCGWCCKNGQALTTFPQDLHTGMGNLAVAYAPASSEYSPLAYRAHSSAVHTKSEGQSMRTNAVCHRLEKSAMATHSARVTYPRGSSLAMLSSLARMPSSREHLGCSTRGLILVLTICISGDAWRGGGGGRGGLGMGPVAISHHLTLPRIFIFGLPGVDMGGDHGGPALALEVAVLHVCVVDHVCHEIHESRQLWNYLIVP